VKNDILHGREFLKDTVRQTVDFGATAQSRGLPPPPPQKPCPQDARRIPLSPAEQFKPLARMSLWNAVANRRSRRRYTGETLSINELSWLLWATQGVHGVRGPTTFRTVPSAGGRHAFETYLFVFRVKGLDAGLYRYLPLDHCLCLERKDDDLAARLTEACFNQTFAGSAAVTFVWSVIPARMEWRYGLASYKVIALDAGHVCQNLYLACEAIRCGTCAIGAYDQKRMDELLALDGVDEFVTYIAPVGRAADDSL
jgi:SagB-type dehydrogenase family enzyme